MTHTNGTYKQDEALGDVPGFSSAEAAEAAWNRLQGLRRTVLQNQLARARRSRRFLLFWALFWAVWTVWMATTSTWGEPFWAPFWAAFGGCCTGFCLSGWFLQKDAERMLRTSLNEPKTTEGGGGG